MRQQQRRARRQRIALASGIRVEAHGIRTGDDKSHVTYVLITGRKGQTPDDVRSAEIAHLRRLGWDVGKQYNDRSRIVDSPDETIWSDVDSGAGGSGAFRVSR